MSTQTVEPALAESGGARVTGAPAHLRVSTLQAASIIWYRDVLRYWRDRTRLVVALAQPLLYLLIFGVGLSSSLGRGALATAGVPSSFSYIQFMYPGIIGMAVLFTAIFSAMSVVWDREFGFMREILVAPISRSAVALGKALGGATQATVQGLVMLVFAPFVGVHLSALALVEVIPLLFLLAFSLTCFGVAVSARMRSLQGFQVMMNFLMMPMFFLSGALFPLQGLPAWMTVLTRLDPVAYGIAPVRSVLLGSAGLTPPLVDRFAAVTINGTAVPLLADVAILLGFGVVMLAIAMRSFRHRD